MFSRESLTDPRRIGLLALALGGAWLGRLFLGDLGAFGDFAFVLVVVLVVGLLPLPTWEEAPERRWVAALGMVALAIVIAVVVTYFQNKRA